MIREAHHKVIFSILLVFNLNFKHSCLSIAMETEQENHFHLTRKYSIWGGHRFDECLDGGKYGG
jgi:hypothetical protein